MTFSAYPFSSPLSTKRRGRGALKNPAGRFEKHIRSNDTDHLDNEDAKDENSSPATQIFSDQAKTIISTNDSPDLRMDTTLNPYRGCEHGCIYCYARPTHEYYGLSAGLDFETKIYVKYGAPQLLKKTLQGKNWQPRTIVLSGVTDCYQPAERRLKITRNCLSVLADFLNPVTIITKNALVTRDTDLLSQLAAHQAASVYLSITTLDRELCRKMEPRASTPPLRLKAIEDLAQAGIPVGVNIGPVIPGLTDHEIPSILKSAASAGASCAHYTMLRLPYGVKDLFQEWLQSHYPDKAKKVLSHILDVRDGHLYDASFGNRMTGTGVYAEQIARLFVIYRKKYKLDKRIVLSPASFRRESTSGQMSLF